MISESVIAAECMSKTFARARNVAKNGGFVYARSIDYEPDVAILRACVESTSWSDYPYDVHVEIDEQNDRIFDYECTCPAHYRYPGMCKHAAALLLLYNQEPQTFKGYSAIPQAITSRSIGALIKRMSAARTPSTNASEQVQPSGSVSLELLLQGSFTGRWNASFKIAGTQGSYVLKDISDFLYRISESVYYEYGKKLGFTHTQDVFTAQAWQVVDWLRDVTSSSRGWWRQFDWQSGGSKRYVYLSAHQIVELLDLFNDMTIEFSEDERIARMRPMRVVKGDPAGLGVRLEELEDGSYRLERAEEMGFLYDSKRLYAWNGHSFFNCSKELSACGDFLVNVYSNGEETLLISDQDMPAFCSAVLPVLESGLQVSTPPKIQSMKPVPGKVEFFLDATGGQAECVAKVSYGDNSYELLNLGNEPGKPARDEAMEGAARLALKRYLPLVDEEYVAHTQDDDDMARLLFYGVDELRRCGDVFTTDAFDRRKAAKRPSLSTGLSVKSNLVNLTVSADEMTPGEIAALIASYQNKKSYHKLKDGSFVNLADASHEELEDLERVAAIAQELGIDAKKLADGTVSVEAYNAFVLDELAQDEEKDASFKEFVDSFKDVRGRDYQPPQELQDVLRPYQTEGFAWLSMLADTGLAGILADEMGLGKSLQTISLLLSRVDELDEHPALIVCPASLVYNWLAEFNKFAPSLDVQVLAGSKGARDEVRSAGGYQVLVTSYDTLRIDIADMANQQFSYQVIDEAQYIKNHATKAAKAVKAVRSMHRIALTGTPIENRLSELWSIFDYLMPGMLGSYKRFRELYETPIIGGDEQMSKRLRAKVGPFILRRLKGDVLSDLPDKLETVIHAKLEGEQAKLYEAHETRLRQSLAGTSEQDLKTGKIAVLAELTKLRQICCDPKLLYSNYKHRAAKMGAICELVQNAVDNGQKVLVFSQFTSFLDLIARELDARKLAHYTITGATPKRERMNLVDKFNADDVPVFLISLKAGGTGLNLVGASVVIHADPWWNAAAQNQATDRAHRIGQTRDVSVFKVIADGTIEERILKLQEAKSDLADAVLAADGASLGSLSRDELIALLTED